MIAFRIEEVGGKEIYCYCIFMTLQKRGTGLGLM